MYMDVIVKGRNHSEVVQRSNYYGRTGIVWRLHRDNDGYIYLTHYDTIILRDNQKGAIELMGGYSVTDQSAINSYLYLSGFYPEFRCARHDGKLFFTEG